MKKIAIVFSLFIILLAASGCAFLDIPSFRLYVGYDLTLSDKIIPNDLSLPTLSPHK